MVFIASGTNLKQAPSKTHFGPTWILWPFIPIQLGGLAKAIRSQNFRKKSMRSPTGLYLAQHGFYSLWYQSQTGPFKNPSGPTWILWPFFPIQVGWLAKAIRSQNFRKKSMISPTGVYLAQHGFYSLWYQSRTAPFKNPSWPNLDFMAFFPIQLGGLARAIRPQKNPK